MSIDFADKAIVDFDLLIFESRTVFHGFMNQDFFDQGVQKFGGQFGGMGALLNKSNPFSHACGSFLFLSPWWLLI